jgi:hypothetical protein
MAATHTNIRFGATLLAAILCVSSVATAEQSKRELNPNAAAERAQQGTRSYNLAVPQGCDRLRRRTKKRRTK